MESEVEALRRELEQERTARKRLEAELQAMRGVEAGGTEAERKGA
jgi:hypothetical protein